MAARRRPRARSRQREGLLAWTGTALVGLALIVGGFGAGVLLGVFSEEPGAIVGVLGGQGERVPLRAPEDANQQLADRARLEAEAPAAVPRESAEPVERVVRAEPARRAAPSALPAVSAAPSGFAVQVGAFATSASARAMESKLAGRGYESFVAAGAAARDQRWRVRIGPYPTREEADRTARRLENVEGLSTWVVDLERSPD